jgi:hypothetical protein
MTQQELMDNLKRQQVIKNYVAIYRILNSHHLKKVCLHFTYFINNFPLIAIKYTCDWFVNNYEKARK